MIKKEEYKKVVKAVESGEDESAKTKLAWYMLSGLGGAKIEVEKAVKILEERVAAGDSEAMWMLGICKEYGRGIERDIEGAEELYKQSSESGNEIGKILVGKRWRGRGSGEMGIGSLLNSKRERNKRITNFDYCYRG